LDQLVRAQTLPALVFAFSRRDCERLARRNAQRELLDPAESARMAALQRELLTQFQLCPSTLDGEILRLARRGLAYHHAGLLPIDKELVERLFTSGLLKLLFATETFALGVNMPARAVVFAALQKFDGLGMSPLSAREYMQMAGRAGRQGLDSEGLVYAMLDGQDAVRMPLERLLLGPSEPVSSRFRLSYSSLLHLMARLGRERLLGAWERSLHCFQRRGKSPSAREREKGRQRQLLEARLAFLEELGYLEQGERLAPKGRIARRINGCELQLTELLFQGLLEQRPPRELAAVFVALSFEDRRRAPERPRLPRELANLRRGVDLALVHLAAAEARHGILPPLRPADWGLGEVTLSFCDGGELVDLADQADLSPGDLVRTFRLAIQLMRQVRMALDPSWGLTGRLEAAQDLLDRDEVDARRQLELG
jgi:superfamily II RNA helicase